MKKKRIITGAVYVVVLIALLALKWLVPSDWGSIGFDLLFTAVSVIGCLELLKAFKTVSYPQKAAAISYCAMVVPLFAISEYTMGDGYISLAVLTLVGIIIQGIFYFVSFGGSNGKSTLLSFFAMGYCGILSALLSGVNHVSDYSVAAVLLLFMVVMITDSVAYFVGSIFKRWLPYKLAPKISPKKTVVGGIGGLIGGMAGAVAAYYIYYGLSLVIGSPEITLSWLHPAVAFLLVGLIASVFGQAGDLFESAIKRKCRIKDSGKLLPGHGGVLDRFDSMLFSGVIILICFSFLIV